MPETVLILEGERRVIAGHGGARRRSGTPSTARNRAAPGTTTPSSGQSRSGMWNSNDNAGRGVLLLIHRAPCPVPAAGHPSAERMDALEEDRMMKWFSYTHLPPHLAEVSAVFANAAGAICNLVQGGPERTVALRKLLEAKDAAVRGVVHPGG